MLHAPPPCSDTNTCGSDAAVAVPEGPPAIVTAIAPATPAAKHVLRNLGTRRIYALAFLRTQVIPMAHASPATMIQSVETPPELGGVDATAFASSSSIDAARASCASAAFFSAAAFAAAFFCR